MSKNYKFKIVLVVLALLIQFLPLNILAKENNVIGGKFQYGSTFGNGDRTGIYYYSDAYFSESGKVLNEHLRTMSLNLALATFQSDDIEGDYSKSSQNIRNLLEDIKFEDIETNEDFNIRQTKDTVGIIIGKKTIEDETLMVVSVRGVGYKGEWANNITLGLQGYPSGFEASAKKVLDFIKSYQEEHEIENSKIWMTGYSRSSAIINIVGTKINEDLELYRTTEDDLYIYAFGTPNSVPLGTMKYENIHNTISKEDYLTYVPGKIWGLTRGGLDDTIIPSKGSEEYDTLYSEFKNQFSKIDTEREYNENEFKEQYVVFELLSGLNVEIKEAEVSRLQSKFVEDFMSFIEDEERFINQGRITREEYALELEPFISDLIDRYMSKEDDERDEIINYLLNVGNDIVNNLKDKLDEHNYNDLLLIGTYVASSPEIYNDNGYDALKDIVVASIDNVEKPDSLEEEDIETIKNTIIPLLKFIKPVIYEDYINDGYENQENYKLRSILSIVNNVDLLLQPHLPEVTLAWMRAMDTYYTTDEVSGDVDQVENEKENFADAKLDTMDKEVLETLLTDEEKELVSLGNDVSIYLVFDKLEKDEIVTKNIDLINDALESNMKLGYYFNIELVKKIQDNISNVENVGQNIKITIKIPEELKGKDSYKVIRIHNDVVDVLNTVVSGDYLSFETDRFSIYALTYYEKVKVATPTVSKQEIVVVEDIVDNAEKVENDDALKTTGTAEIKKSNKISIYIYIGVGAVVLVLLGIFVIKKIRKK